MKPTVKVFEKWSRTRSRLAGCLQLSALMSAACHAPDEDDTVPMSAADPADPLPAPASAEATVTVDVASPLATVAPFAFGLHTSVYDNSLHHPDLPTLLDDAGITILRYPGGGYSDNYHWSTHTMTAWADGSVGYLAPASDFGSYVSVAERANAATMITVNYGSNLDGSGPGEPKEAAAWVAYANGEPDDETTIGEDTIGNDWQTVGYWAGLRASEPLESDDGFNFLRIDHPEPLGITYWEVGNEVFGNGYYEGDPYELDLHVPNDGTVRAGHPDLSPTTYGSGVSDFVAAMKAVDPTIKVGAVLNTPPNDYNWGPTWNQDVLAECGEVIDFVIVHLYAGRDAAGMLRVPTRRVPEMTAELNLSIATYAGDNAPNVEITMTEIGPRPGFPATDVFVAGIYAADVYVTLMEHGIVNIDWLELHNPTFLAELTQEKGPAYHGIEMARHLVRPGDTLVAVTATSNTDDTELFAAHAVDRQDGNIGLMLVNRAPATTLQTSVDISGVTLDSTGERFDYVLDGTVGEVQGPSPTSELGNAFSIELPPHSVTVLTLPKLD